MADVANTQVVRGSQDAEQHTCVRCGCDCSIDDGAFLRGQSTYTCKSCTNLYQILYRHAGGMPASWQGMTQEKQRDFFRSTGKAVQTCGKNARWSLIRASLVTSVVNSHTTQTTTTVKKKFLPLSVWAARGFNTDDIQARGEKQSDEALFFSRCVRVRN